MDASTWIAGMAVVVSICAAFFSWKTSVKSNQLARINSLIALRGHYFESFQRDVEFCERFKGMPGALKSAGESGEKSADRMRAIDAALASHYERLMRETQQGGT